MNWSMRILLAVLCGAIGIVAFRNVVPPSAVFAHTWAELPDANTERAWFLDQTARLGDPGCHSSERVGLASTRHACWRETRVRKEGVPGAAEVRFWSAPGRFRLRLQAAGGEFRNHQVEVVDASGAVVIALLLASIALLLPGGMAGTRAAKPIAAWRNLLSESHGGLSLARFQLFLWFVPSFVILGTFALVRGDLEVADIRVPLLLGMSGLTAVLGAAASPPPTEGATEAVPELQDLITNWRGEGDVSRYQCLLLSILGIGFLVITSAREMQVPVIPEEFLVLLGASQGLYIGAKTVLSRPAA